MTVKLIDVTLRESVHVEGVPLSLESAGKFVRGLSEAHVDFIEIGYVESVHSGQTYLPEYSPLEYIEELARNLEPASLSQLVLMIHPRLYEQSMLARMKHAKVGMIRLCIPLKKVNESLKLIDTLKQEGLTVSANLIRASHASLSDILDFAKNVEHAGADYMYLADSNGAMLPSQVSELYKALHATTAIKLGFHPHNNLHLASANAIEAIKAGATIIDGSVYGFGKGAGNLCLESFVACLKKMEMVDHRDLGRLIAASKQAYRSFIEPLEACAYEISEEGILTGFHNINLDIQDHLEQLARKRGTSLFELLLTLENQTMIQRAESVLHKAGQEKEAVTIG